MPNETKTGLIYEVIPKIIAELGAVPQTERSPQGYQYRSIHEITKVLQPLLAKHGVFIVPTKIETISNEERTAKSGVIMVSRVRKVQFTLYASDGSSIIAEVEAEALDNSDKAAPKIMSMSLKSLLGVIFCIPITPPMDTEAADTDRGEAPRAATPEADGPPYPPNAPQGAEDRIEAAKGKNEAIAAIIAEFKGILEPEAIRKHAETGLGKPLIEANRDEMIVALNYIRGQVKKARLDNKRPPDDEIPF